MLKYLIVTASILGAGPALADPKFEYGKAEEVKDVKGTEWNASAEAGVVFTTGNSETITATGGLKAARKEGNNKLSIEASAAYAKSGIRVLDDQNGNMLIDNEGEIRSVRTITAETFAGKLRYDRFLTTFNSLFIAALASRDVPAGRNRVLGAQLGYSRQLYKSDKAEAVGEFGADYSNEDLASGEPVSIISARAFVGYKAEMTAGTTFETSLEGLTNLNEETLPTGADGRIGRDTRVNFKASISAKIGKNLAFQSSMEARYDHRPGPLPVAGLAPGFVPEATRMDTIMKASFIYTIF